MKPYILNETDGDHLTLDVVDNEIVLSIVNPFDIEDQKSLPLRTEDIEHIAEILICMKNNTLEGVLR